MNMCMCVCVCLLFRSIQKLEELNVGMENLGEEVKSLTQQCNGNGNTPASEDNNNPPTVTPERTRNHGGGVISSSTPQCTVGGRTVPPPDESPVVTQRYLLISIGVIPLFFLALSLMTTVFCVFGQCTEKQRRSTRRLSRLLVSD